MSLSPGQTRLWSTRGILSFGYNTTGWTHLNIKKKRPQPAADRLPFLFDFKIDKSFCFFQSLIEYLYQVVNRYFSMCDFQTLKEFRTDCSKPFVPFGERRPASGANLPVFCLVFDCLLHRFCLQCQKLCCQFKKISIIYRLLKCCGTGVAL